MRGLSRQDGCDGGDGGGGEVEQRVDLREWLGDADDLWEVGEHL